jgi:4-carboxymuconolactone decarboxylase
MTNYPDSPREAARAFTPELMDLINNPLYSDVWTDARLSPRDRSIATLAALTVLYRPEELPAHLRRARDNGVTNDEISALITHCAFYGGFPAAISTSMIAADTLL